MPILTVCAVLTCSDLIPVLTKLDNSLLATCRANFLRKKICYTAYEILMAQVT